MARISQSKKTDVGRTFTSGKGNPFAETDGDSKISRRIIRTEVTEVHNWAIPGLFQDTNHLRNWKIWHKVGGSGEALWSQ